MRTGIRQRRGMALLLVMVALVVGMILTAGYLTTQSTANGLSRNEKSVVQTRMIAEAGVDSCVWLIKNKSDWRRTMTPGAWITNMSVNGGTLTVNVLDGDNSGNFADDNTQSAIIQSTATFSGQTVQVNAIVTPSGGGKPWANGIFVNSGPTMSNYASIDAYNSSVGLYPLSQLLTAVVGTGATGSGCSNSCGGNCGSGCGCGNSTCGQAGNHSCTSGIIMNGNSSILGSVVGTTGSVLSALLGGSGGQTAPSVVTTAPESRTLGVVVPPNVTGFVAAGAFSKSLSVPQPVGNETFDSFAINKPSGLGTTLMTVTKSATYYVKGNFTLDQATTVKVNTGSVLTFYVAGNTDIQGTVSLVGTGTFILYSGGTVTIRSNAVLNNQATTGQLLILGLPTDGTITIKDNAVVAGGIYAPKAVVRMQSYGTLYGSAVGQSIIMADNTAMHLDDVMKTRVFHNITGGTTMGDYTVTWVRSNGGINH